MDFFLYSTSTAPEVFNIKLEVAYDGTDFLGWQDTAFGPSIEGSLKKALEIILQEKIILQAASRTDAGVHAEGQVVNFFTHKKRNLSRLQLSLNALLPPTIRIFNIEEMELSFHPTLDAREKQYHYHIYCGPILPPKERLYCWHVVKPLSLDKMQKAIPYFLGHKDFSAFSNMNHSQRSNNEAHLLEINLALKREKLTIIVRGERFLYKMVRNIVGTLVFIGKGTLNADMLPQIFSSKKRNKVPMTAPACGLILKKIIYDRKK